MNIYPDYISIDFGTSNTTAAYWDAANQKSSLVRFNNSGLYKFPSILYYEDNNIAYGQSAWLRLRDTYSISDINERTNAQRNFVLNLKKYLGHDTIPVQNQRRLRVEDVLSSFFTAIKNEIENRYLTGQILSNVMLTHPVAYSTKDMKVLENAALKSGFSRIQFLPEPVAAVYSYDGFGDRLVVLDIGGGTLDLAYLTKSKNGNFSAKSKEGELNLGGSNIDEDIYDHVIKKYDLYEKLNAILPNEYFKDNEILYQCRLFKEGFSRAIVEGAEKHSHTMLLGDEKGGNHGMLNINMSLNEFEKIISPTIEKIINKVIAFVGNIQKKGDAVDNILLTGGASLLPILKNELKSALEIEPIGMEDYDTSVATGSCIFANKFLSRSSEEFSNDKSLIAQFENAKKRVYDYEDRRSFNTISKLANSGFLPAVFEMGKLYFNGSIVVKKDIDEAFFWYEQCAKGKFVPGITELASIYLASNDNTLMSKAFDLFTQLEDIEEGMGKLGLAKCYWYGLGVNQNKSLGEAYFIDIVKSGDGNGVKEYLIAFSKEKFNSRYMIVYGDELEIPNSKNIFSKCQETYSNNLADLVMIFNHQFALGIPTRSGIVITANSVRWNHDNIISTPIALSWNEINPEGIKHSNNKLVLNNVSANIFPYIGNKEEIFARFKEVIQKMIDLNILLNESK